MRAKDVPQADRRAAPGDLSLALLAAHLHFERSATLQDIKAKKPFRGMSVSSIHRLIQQAREYVDIRVHGPHDEEIRARLRGTFEIDDAIVVDAGGEEFIGAVLAEATATFFASRVRSGDCVAVSCGHTLLNALLQLRPLPDLKLHIVPLSIEGSANDIEEAPATLVGLLKAKCHKDSTAVGAHLAHTGNQSVDEAYRKRLQESPFVIETKRTISRADWVFFGIGPASSYSTRGRTLVPSFVRLMNAATGNTYISTAQRLRIVGEINNEPYTSEGDSAFLLDRGFGRRASGSILSLCTLEQLRTMASRPDRHHVVAVAGGKFKVKAISTALQAGFLNTLITDRRTASAILDLSDRGAKKNSVHRRPVNEHRRRSTHKSAQRKATQ